MSTTPLPLDGLSHGHHACSVFASDAEQEALVLELAPAGGLVLHDAPDGISTVLDAFDLTESGAPAG